MIVQDPSVLADLPILPLEVVAVAGREGLFLPEFAGSSLRGAFGRSLRSLVCVETHRDTCAGCPMLTTCAYPRLFEPKATPEQLSMSGFSDPPRSYVLRAAPGLEFVPPGQTFSWRIHLMGRAIEDLALFILSWREVGRHGVGRNRNPFELAAVRSLDREGQPAGVIYQRGSKTLQRPNAPLGLDEMGTFAECASPDGQTLTLDFVSPTEIQVRKQPVARPEFQVLWGSLQRRLSALRYFHGAGRPDLDFRALLDRAAAVELVDWRVRQVDWERYSRRQDRRVPMTGWMGRATYRGPLREFLPALALGSYVGVGDNCTFGQGAYILAVDRPQPITSPETLRPSSSAPSGGPRSHR